MEEIIRTVAFPGSRLVSNLRPIYPGTPPSKPKPPPKAAAAPPSTSEGGTAAPSSNDSRPPSASTVRTGRSAASGTAGTEEDVEGEGEDQQSYHSYDMQENYEDEGQEEGSQAQEDDGSTGGGSVHMEQPQSSETENPATEGPSEGAEAGAAGSAEDPEDIERMLAELDEVTPEEMAAEMARMKKIEDERIAAEKATQRAQEQVKKIHLEAVNAYMESGSAFSYLYKKSFELQNKQLFDIVIDRISQLDVYAESPVSEEHFHEELDSILSLLELQKVGVTNFLLNSMCFPKSAMSDRLEWSAWLSLLLAWKSCLIHDLNKLQTFRYFDTIFLKICVDVVIRINAGLIKPEDGNKKKKHLTAEQEKAILNKEKVCLYLI